MELRLSLGDSSKDSKLFKFSTKNSNSEHHDTAINNKQDGLVFCMALGLNSTVGNRESRENYDQDDDQMLQESDDHQEKLMGTPVQLDLLPLDPVPFHTGSLLRVSGSSKNSSLRLSKEQSAYLEENFKENSTLNPKQKLALAKQLNLRPRQVEVWFQNRRARTKLKQTEVDREYLKRFFDSLTEENRRLHKELQELRALNSSNPFCMGLPATTLTMCPSCERVATSSSTTPTTTPAANPPISKESTTKVIPLPLFRPRFYPFSCSPTHSHQSAPS